MKALVFHGPGKRSWEDKPKPAIEKPTDAVVRITHTTICGTDLHILKGDVPAVTEGRRGVDILRHFLRALRLLQTRHLCPLS